MSFILDALKKAEEEKKLLQKSPQQIDIKEEVFADGKPRSSGIFHVTKKALVSAAVLVLVVLATFGAVSLFSGGGKSPQPSEQALIAVPETKPAPAPSATPVPPPVQTAPSAVSAPQPAPPPVQTAEPVAAKPQPVPTERPAAVSKPVKKTEQSQAPRVTAQPKAVEKNERKAPVDSVRVASAKKEIKEPSAPSISLEGITFHPNPDERKASLKLGKEKSTVKVGDAVGAWLVKEIGLDSVTVQDHEKQLVLKLQ